MCARAALTGINPPGHAPLVVESARYNDSDCWYDGPDGEPLLIYHDAPSDAPDWDKKLLIHFPNKNLFPLFEWPAPVVTFDPPLREGETAPTITLKLASLQNLNPPTTVGESEIGVQLPMRLVIRKPDSPSYSVTLRELIYENAPGFTGSDESVTFTLAETGPQAAGGAVFQVTAREIRDAVEGAPGLYSLHWLIYHGSGDMNYQAVCQSVETNAEGIPQASESTLPGEYRDRRSGGIGGGFGTFDTTDLAVARVEIQSTPGPFAVLGYSISLTGFVRAYPNLLTGARFWQGPLRGGSIVVGWSGSSVYLGGRLAYQAPGSVLCAAIREVSGSDSLPDGDEIVALIGADGDALEVWAYRLVYGHEARRIASLARPSAVWTDAAAKYPDEYAFAPDLSGLWPIARRKSLIIRATRCTPILYGAARSGSAVIYGVLPNGPRSRTTLIARRRANKSGLIRPA
ncbi:MAG: hypothetical protein MZV65_00900 [Chromatiales bacterium]|nr:hypothetical protein [Chromatiales bacterium]